MYYSLFIFLYEIKLNISSPWVESWDCLLLDEFGGLYSKGHFQGGAYIVVFGDLTGVITIIKTQSRKEKEYSIHNIHFRRSVIP